MVPPGTPLRVGVVSGPWRGINHLALVTPDMDATVRFYAGLLGMRVVATTMAGPMRHYFFEVAEHSTIAFFENAAAPTFSKPAGEPTDRAIQLDHVSINVPDERALDDLRERLLAAGREVTEVIDHRMVRSIYFNDPNGIALEASYWAVDPWAADRSAEAFQDPDPVPALADMDVLRGPAPR